MKSGEACGEPQILVYTPLSLTGGGPGQSCVSILTGFPARQPRTSLFAPRCRLALPQHVAVHEALPRSARPLPWRLVSDRALKLLDRMFAEALHTADPAQTVAYFWPSPPVGLVEAARRHGVATVREMINTACATSGPILDAAYARLGLPPTHSVTSAKISEETRELAAYDYFFASNAEVERSLLNLGVESARILPTSFGWSPERFADTAPAQRHAADLRYLFVGTLSVRKGVPELLEAWARAAVPGELILAGRPTPEIADLVSHHEGSGRVRTLGYIEDVGALFRSADVFIFPTHEEGGPQVTYEAAGCGLPIITTAMGAARLVEDGRTGIIVEPGSVEQLAKAIRVLAYDEHVRSTYAANARERAMDFDNRTVGGQRYDYLRQILETGATR